jgi:hypothetical protein
MSFVLQAPLNHATAFLSFLGDLITEHDREERLEKGSSLVPASFIDELRPIYLQSRVDQAVLHESEVSLMPLRRRIQSALGLPCQALPTALAPAPAPVPKQPESKGAARAPATAFEVVRRLSAYLRPYVENHPARLIRYGFSLVRPQLDHEGHAACALCRLRPHVSSSGAEHTMQAFGSSAAIERPDNKPPAGTRDSPPMGGAQHAPQPNRAQAKRSGSLPRHPSPPTHPTANPTANPMKHAIPPSFPATLLALLLPCLLVLLCQCQAVSAPNGRSLNKKETRKVLAERYYTMNGKRMVERRVLITDKPRLETWLYSEALD